MIDLGISKLAMIGVVALIVLGPEKLPRVARTVGTLIGKAQRYIRDVQAEVHHAMQMDDLKKMKETVETAAHNIQQSCQTHAFEFEQSWAQGATSGDIVHHHPALPQYHHPKKNWHLKQSVVPRWYKARTGIRTKVLSDAARSVHLRLNHFKG